MITDLYPAISSLGDLGLALTVFLSVLSYDASKGVVKWISFVSRVLKDIGPDKK